MGLDTYGKGPANAKGLNGFGVQQSYQDTLSNIVEVAGSGGLWQALHSSLFAENYTQLPNLSAVSATPQNLFSAQLQAGVLGKLARTLKITAYGFYDNAADAAGPLVLTLNIGSTAILAIAGGAFTAASGNLGFKVEFLLNISALPTSTTASVSAAAKLEIVSTVNSASGPANVYVASTLVTPVTISTNAAQALAIAATSTSGTLNGTTGTQLVVATVDVLN